MTDTATVEAERAEETPPENRQAPARAAPKPAVQAGGTISAMIPTDIDQAFRLANAIAMSGMAPKAYGTDPNKCFVGILAGAEVGLAPFTALQSIAVIGNNPAIWGDGALALIQSSGLLVDIEETDDGHTATCAMTRKGKPTPIVRSFSMDDAKKAGLAGKTGPWTQYPQRMRQMRARSWAMRDGFADVLKGLHIAEEVRDRPGMADGGDVSQKPQRLSSAMLAQQAGVTVEHDEDGVVTAETVEAETVEPEQGRADEDHGDQFDGTEPEREAEQSIPRWHDDVQRITDDLYTAQTMADIKAAGAELDKVRVTLPEAEVTRLESLFADAKAAFQAKGA